MIDVIFRSISNIDGALRWRIFIEKLSCNFQMNDDGVLRGDMRQSVINYERKFSYDINFLCSIGDTAA